MTIATQNLDGANSGCPSNALGLEQVGAQRIDVQEADYEDASPRIGAMETKASPA